MSQRLKTFLQVWCLLTVILFLLGFYFTEDKSSRSYLYHVAVEQPEDQPGQEVTEFHPDTRKILYGDNQQCRLRKKIIFAKTHKTGSTTLQNIVFRQITKKVDAQAKSQGRDSVLLQDFQPSDGNPSSERVQ